jgi:hypothetical protein
MEAKMKSFFVASLSVIFGLSLSSGARAIDAKQCKDALVRDTFSTSETRLLDWRLAEFVSESEYNEKKQGGGVSVLIYGVPVGANYAEFRENIRKFQRARNESLTLDEAFNTMWTALGDNAASAYKACLDAVVSGSSGLHLTVESATETDITARVTWTVRPPANPPRRIRLNWSGARVAEGDELTRYLVPNGSNIVRLLRPDDEMSVTVNSEGNLGDSITLTPLPKPVQSPCVGALTAKSRFVYSGDLRSNNFSLLVPPCGAFTLKANISNYKFQYGSPVGPEEPPTPHTETVQHSLCVQTLSDANGPFIRVHIDRGCGDRNFAGADARVYFRRATTPLFSDPAVAENWGEIVEEIEWVNSRF